MGIDISKVDIRSNNLGNRNRTMMNLFLEHRFYFLSNKIDVTPGIASNYFSDFGWHSFPGIDFGVQLTSKFRFYGNLGSTYRIPTFTDLFYLDRTLSISVICCCVSGPADSASKQSKSSALFFTPSITDDTFSALRAYL